jgi:ABC-type glycerol-3-phosphate transport system substrate-binding protein
LTFWVPEEFAVGAERGGDMLDSQLSAFQAEHPGIKINYVLKAPSGKGGIVDWLTQLVALMPDRLPDAAIVDSRELDQIEALGLLHPLNRNLPSGVFWDLFPPAQQIARRGGKWVDQPLVLETEHLVYDARRVPSPPASWDAVLATKTPFAFAADGTDTFLLHYLQNGGALSPTEHTALDSGVMQAILEYYQRARANGNLNDTTAVMKSAREVLPLFVTGQVLMAQVRARDFLSERSRLPNASAASVPSRDGQPAALVSAWTFVVLTSDSTRQQAATSYLGWLDDAARMGEWANAARLVPASQSAFAQAIQPPEYADTLRTLLTRGIVAPPLSQQMRYANAWRTAVEAVLSGQMAPEDAAFRAIQTVTQ